MSEEKKEYKVLTITDLPILERSQFFNPQKTPMRSELMKFVQDSGLKDKMSSYVSRQPKECQLANHILFDQRRHLIFREDLVEKYPYDIIENAKSYMSNYIKLGGIPHKDHVALVGWFVDQLVDIEKTVALNGWAIDYGKDKLPG